MRNKQAPKTNQSGEELSSEFDLLLEEADRGPADASVIESATPDYDEDAPKETAPETSGHNLETSAESDTIETLATETEAAAVEALRSRDPEEVRNELHTDLNLASDIIEGYQDGTSEQLREIYAKLQQAKAAGVLPFHEDQSMMDRLTTRISELKDDDMIAKPFVIDEEAPEETPVATFEEAAEPVTETLEEVESLDEGEYNRNVSNMIDNLIFDTMFDPDRSVDAFESGLGNINQYIAEHDLALNPEIASRIENFTNRTQSWRASHGAATPTPTPEASTAETTPTETAAEPEATVETVAEPAPVAAEEDPEEDIFGAHVEGYTPEEPPVEESVVEPTPVDEFLPVEPASPSVSRVVVDSTPEPTPADTPADTPTDTPSSPEPAPTEPTPETTPDGGHDGGEGEPTPADEHDGAEGEPTPEAGHDGAEEEPRSLKDVMNQGHDAMILALYNEEDQKNILREALAIKAQKVSREHPLMTRLPFIGRVIKAGMVARGSKEARQAALAGNYDQVYEALNLDASDKERSNILRTISGSVEERSRRALDEAGYTSENPVDKVVGIYDDQNRVERLNPEQEAAAKETLNNYFTRLENHEDAATLDQEFDQNIKELFKENPALATSFRTQRDRLKEYYDSGEFGLAAIREYVSDSTLYMGKQRESLYKIQKTDGLIAATAAAGFAGALAYTLLARQAQSEARGAMTPLAGAGVGAVAGGVFGAISGWGRAGQRASEHEMAEATKFENPEAAAAAETGEAEGATPEGEAIEGETPEGATPEGEGEAATSEAAGEGDAAEAEAAAAEAPTEVLEVTPDHPEAQEGFLTKAYKGILGGLNRLDRAKRKYLYGEEKYFDKIEELRDRKDANQLMEQFDQLIAEKREHPTGENVANLEDLYAEIIARGRVSRDQRIDLVKFDNNRPEFEQKLREVAAELYGEDFDPTDMENAPEGLKDRINHHREIFLNKDKQARAELLKYQTRAALTDAVTSAVMAAGAGALIQFGTTQLKNIFGGMMGETNPNGQNGNNSNINELMEEANKPGGKGVSLEQDPDGGYSVKIGDQTVIGEGDQPGIDYNDDGTLTDASRSALEALGLTVEDNIGTRPAPDGALRFESLEDFFNRGNAGQNGLTTISGRTWSDGDPVTIYDPVADGDGNIILQVVPNGYQGNLGDLDMFISPGKSGMTAISLDVQPNGTVVIPAGSAASALFEGNQLIGRVEVGNVSGDGIAHILATDGPGAAVGRDINIPSPNPITEIPVHEYSITSSDGTSIQLETPPMVDAIAAQTILREGQPTIGTDELNGINYSEETVSMRTNTGEVVELHRGDHFGGYQSVTDTFNSVEKRASGNTGTSVVDELLERHTGQQVDGRSIEDVDAQFMQMVQNGEISESEVVDQLLSHYGNSAENVVTMRTYMGGLTADLGQGQVTIDTEDEINALADIISRDPEAYDNFVNDTFDMFYDRVSGGSLMFVDLQANPYQFTTWSQLIGDNIHQALGQVTAGSTNGIGIVFRDASGQSIYDEATVRSILHIPDNYSVDEIAPRLDCGGQMYVRVSILQEEAEAVAATRRNQPTRGSAGDETTSGDEPTPKEIQESAGDEPTPKEIQESAGEEPTPKDIQESVGEEPTPKDIQESVGEEPTPKDIQESVGEEPTPKDIQESIGEEPTPKTESEPTPKTIEEPTPSAAGEDAKGPINITTGDSGFAPTDVNTEQPKYPDNVYEGTPDDNAFINPPSAADNSTPAGNVQYQPETPAAPTDTEYIPDTSVHEGGAVNPNVGVDKAPEPVPDLSESGTAGDYQDPGEARL